MTAPLVGIVMGSQSDWDVMKHACAQLEAFQVPFESQVLSAHRMPDQMFAYAERAREPKKLVLLPGGHFEAYTGDFDIASGAARDWFLEHLGSPG